MAAIRLLPCTRAAFISRLSLYNLHTAPRLSSLQGTQIVHKKANQPLGIQLIATHLTQKLVYHSTLARLASRLPCQSVRTVGGGRVWPALVVWRGMAMGESPYKKADRTSLIYILAIFIFMVGASYAAVPLYRIFCQATGRGGQAVVGHDTSKIETMSPVTDRPITIKFNADVASSMQWNFRPQQSEVKVLPGETALAFYTARNPTDAPIIGISTYNVVPFEAGAYFNKIQCFCFEEQRLNPHEQVDMPVFFYIDPEFVHDPKLQGLDQITLSYTFFESKEGLNLPLPGYIQAQPQ